MLDPDTEGHEFVKAGDFPGFSDHMSTQLEWKLFSLLYLLGVDIGKLGSATSITSNSLSVGSKTFQLSGSRSWPIGTPLYIVAEGESPLTAMWGSITSAPTDEGVVILNIESIKGNVGTFTSWAMLAILATTPATASNPVTEAQGGFAGTSFAAGRTNMEVLRYTQIKSTAYDSTPFPGFFPATDEKYLILPDDDFGGNSDPEFGPNVDKIGEWDGSSWSYESRENGEAVFDESSNSIFLKASLNVTYEPVRIGSAWRDTGKLKFYEVQITSISADGSLTLPSTSFGAGGYTAISPLNGNCTLTLPDIDAELKVTLINPSAYDLVINAEGSQDINGISSVTLQSGLSMIVYRISGIDQWHAISP